MLTEVDATRFSDVYQENLAVPGAPPHPVPYKKSNDGDKESWYKKIVPSGMLPALELDGRMITESDVILDALEGTFGPLGRSIRDPQVMRLRRLERELFGAWCEWLCRPARSSSHEKMAVSGFEETVGMVEAALGETEGPFFLGSEITVADIVFVPYVERMAASLYYYKGYTLRDPVAHPKLSAWFDALESNPTYLAIQSDYHTHAHDLPPQMGGCYENGTPAQKAAKNLIDNGPWDATIPEISTPAPEGNAALFEVLRRVVRHYPNVIKVNQEGTEEETDVCLRAALTTMIRSVDQPESLPSPSTVNLPSDGDAILRYIRDRISVPRDMSVHAARAFRTAIEKTASTVGNGQGKALGLRDRRDQDPRPFRPAI